MSTFAQFTLRELTARVWYIWHVAYHLRMKLIPCNISITWPTLLTVQQRTKRPATNVAGKHSTMFSDVPIDCQQTVSYGKTHVCLYLYKRHCTMNKETNQIPLSTFYLTLKVYCEIFSIWIPRKSNYMLFIFYIQSYPLQSLISRMS